MKKVLMLLAMMAGMSSVTANAATFNHYMGVNLGTQRLAGSSVGSAEVHFGGMFNKNVGLELGLAKTGSASLDSAKLMTTSVNVVGVEPLDKVINVKGLDAVGMVGLEAQTLTASTSHKDDDCKTIVDNLNATHFGPDIAAGLQYHLTERVSVRGLVKYEDVGFSAIGQNHDVRSTIGLNVAF